MTDLVAAGLFGLVLGAIYFAWLWRSVSSFTVSHGTPQTLALGAVLRLALIVGAVGGALWLDVAPLSLLFGGLGFFAARVMAITLLPRVSSGI